MSQLRGEPTGPTNPVEAVEALVSPRFVLSMIMNIHTISNIKNFKLCKIINHLVLRNLFSWYSRTLKIKISPFPPNNGVPYVPATTVPEKFVDIVTKT